MATAASAEQALQPARFASRNDGEVVSAVPDSLAEWVDRYLSLAVAGVRSAEVAAKIALHLQRFCDAFAGDYGHDRISTVGRRDVVRWVEQLATRLAPATVNNHLASLSGFLAWVAAQSPASLPSGDPSAGVGTLPLPPLEPRTLPVNQVRSLKNLCDRLDRFAEHKGRHRTAASRGSHGHARPWRDRAIVYMLLSTGLRRAELVDVDLDQLVPGDPARLRAARRARLVDVAGKGRSRRTVFLSADARTAVADYLERERPTDADEASSALLLSASSIASRRDGGRLSPRTINAVLERIGRLHDAEQTDVERHVTPLRPHDLRHTFAFQLAAATGADAYELERRLGHRSQRYIARYTNPPEDVAAGYVEAM